MTDLVWYSAELQSSEHFTAELDAASDGSSGDEAQTGPRLRGTVVLSIDGQPAHITYEIVADAGWRTRRVEILVDRPDGQTAVGIAADGAGEWLVNGEPAPELAGCLDIDLGWTPATNTFQVRRLGLEVGEQQTLAVAWMRFPEIELERVDQTYERLGPATWRYSSGDFSTVLQVGGDGFVRRYGEDGLWVAIAAGSGSSSPDPSGTRSAAG